MRLWHIDILPYLPKSQLLAQWRELNSIFKKQDRHILINYIYTYDKRYLLNYTIKVLAELRYRNIKVRSLDAFESYFHETCLDTVDDLRFAEHDNTYLLICYYNLKEKFIRSQFDFTIELYNSLTNYISGTALKIR